MPLIETSGYIAPWWLRNGHVATLAGAFRRAPHIDYTRERIETPDDDFLDLDWAGRGNAAGRRVSRLVIISYGMESGPSSPYVRACVAQLQAADFDVLVWNYRGCGGAPNRKVHFYHGGLIGDLEAVIHHALSRGHADIRLAGFSLGGNLTLNYLGHRGKGVPPAVKRAVAFSTPTDVGDCARELHKPIKRIYAKIFLRAFREKIRAKMAVMPGHIDDHAFNSIETLEDYDERYTVPHFGFPGVPEFYRAVSSRHVIAGIRVPVLVVSALDDPFMGPDCIPYATARDNPDVFLECPAHGGHLGFLQPHGGGWMEKRVVEFLTA